MDLATIHTHGYSYYLLTKWLWHYLGWWTIPVMVVVGVASSALKIWGDDDD